MASFYARVARDVDTFVRVESVEEEICELYSTYYATDSGSSRLERVDPTAQEIEVEIAGGARTVALTIAQNPHLNGERGQTGAVVWNSSVVMGEFLARQSVRGWDLAGVTAVELGAGCGVVGLAVHQLGARRVVLTDQARMMRLLARNAAANGPGAHPARGGGGRRGMPERELLVTEFSWGHPPEDPRVLAHPVDVVIVSDCVYHEDVAPLLVASLVDVCRSRSDGVPVVALVGQELRSDLVHHVFVEHLVRHFVLFRVPVHPSVDPRYALYAMWLRTPAPC
ncbi:hypothetical protein IWQ56_000984 [Coemansia nantahalensis]|uniref:Uncharacterized protein n=1 Tax=Coemansia nantahalensis TaxID=2789366 RepID=A0ACC1JXU0_9FUNG|nr:hypothetical protein IWQ57_003071 [Coemansia nantahalensis]KAJ2773466.1 hypothetical protein IWQ56_000984 [Coemansia nantahalensis]